MRKDVKAGVPRLSVQFTLKRISRKYTKVLSFSIIEEDIYFEVAVLLPGSSLIEFGRAIVCVL